jgi:hypothetical protein
MENKIPDGFEELVKLVKKNPVPVVKGKGIWVKFCRAVMIGKNISDAEISFLSNMLKDKLDYDYVLKTSGEDWRDDIEKFLKERMQRIQDEEINLMLTDFMKGLFYFTASIKAGARFFKEKNLFESIDSYTDTKENTWKFIKEIVDSKDLTGIRYAKSILWLQSTGRARDFAPPTVQLKSFINNDVGPYYKFYEDDDYFMKQAEELGKNFKGATLMDVYRAIFFYKALKFMTGRGSKLTPKKIIVFLKKNKITVEKLSEMLSDIDQRSNLMEKIQNYK